MRFLFIAAACAAWPAGADIVVPTRTIRASSVIMDIDVTLREGDIADGFSHPAEVVGQEARVVLYAGRPIFVGDIGPPAIVTRNQIVQIEFHANGLRIQAEARAMERGAAGDRVRVMNLDSKATLFGHVQDDGTILVR